MNIRNEESINLELNRTRDFSKRQELLKELWRLDRERRENEHNQQNAA